MGAPLIRGDGVACALFSLAVDMLPLIATGDVTVEECWHPKEGSLRAAIAI